MRRSLGSTALVAAQFVLLSVLAVLAPWPALGPWRIALFLAALVLVAWAMRVMDPATFSVFPEPRPGGTLVLRGPYRLVRHPMYLAVLMAAVALGSAPPPGAHTLCAVLLLPVIVAKVLREEKALDLRYPERAERMRRVPRLLPGLW
ncbi:MAG: isoprenylcysteine carboxylmethyltransferase family protein [Flavobacteriales bacterium]|nr:hypothetical protein [Flavobacteriales bacterium]MCC6576422.1 isoprenylcysteine carboxylmethyltransferase family protein [Flavobacteriales bacterium]NUQ15990.1 isoprenylcysteine carboxylmethyltransferase family protein [Flavobacteriales bacterium]